MKNLFQRFAIVLLALWLSACASVGGRAGGQTQGRDYFPGGVQFYSYGVSQSKENFANVERAQSDYTLFPTRRTWGDDKPGRPFANVLGLQTYYRLHVRWKLKDGREFILEDIDMRPIMHEYFKTNDIQMPWQKEGRPMDRKGDYEASLVHEVKDDTVIIKWWVITNHTPVAERFTPSGAATHWKRTDEEFIVTTIKGVPTSGIDFEKKWEFNRTNKAKE
jgi:hypothetical protein